MTTWDFPSCYGCITLHCKLTAQLAKHGGSLYEEKTKGFRANRLVFKYLLPLTTDVIGVFPRCLSFLLLKCSSTSCSFQRYDTEVRRRTLSIGTPSLVAISVTMEE